MLRKKTQLINQQKKMAKSKQHRRSPMTTDKLYKVENTPVKETPRYDGDGTEWIFESPDGGKTIYKRAIGSDEKILVAPIHFSQH